MANTTGEPYGGPTTSGGTSTPPKVTGQLYPKG